MKQGRVWPDYSPLDNAPHDVLVSVLGFLHILVFLGGILPFFPQFCQDVGGALDGGDDVKWRGQRRAIKIRHPQLGPSKLPFSEMSI